MSALITHMRGLPRNEQIIATIGFIAGVYAISAGAWMLL